MLSECDRALRCATPQESKSKKISPHLKIQHQVVVVVVVVGLKGTKQLRLYSAQTLSKISAPDLDKNHDFFFKNQDGLQKQGSNFQILSAHGFHPDRQVDISACVTISLTTVNRVAFQNIRKNMSTNSTVRPIQKKQDGAQNKWLIAF